MLSDSSLRPSSECKDSLLFLSPTVLILYFPSIYHSKTCHDICLACACVCGLCITCVCTHVCEYICMHAYGVQRLTAGVFLHWYRSVSFFFFDRGFLTVPSNFWFSLIGWLPRELQQSAFLSLPI